MSLQIFAVGIYKDPFSPTFPGRFSKINSIPNNKLKKHQLHRFSIMHLHAIIIIIIIIIIIGFCSPNLSTEFGALSSTRVADVSLV